MGLGYSNGIQGLGKGKIWLLEILRALRQTCVSAGASVGTSPAMRAESSRLGPSDPGSNSDLPSVRCVSVGVPHN